MGLRLYAQRERRHRRWHGTYAQGYQGYEWCQPHKHDSDTWEYCRMRLANLLRGWGSTGVDPATPTLTVSDNADGSGGVATITGSTGGTTNVLYRALWT